MKGKKVVHSSDSDEWCTPKDLFLELSQRYGPFDLDAAASKENTLCKEYYTKEDSALDYPWFGRVWCNPPYSLWQKFVEKAWVENAHLRCESATLLLPARTDTKAFHTYIYNPVTRKFRYSVEVQFIKGRLKFSGSQHGAPFPSIVVHFK